MTAMIRRRLEALEGVLGHSCDPVALVIRVVFLPVQGQAPQVIGAHLQGRRRDEPPRYIARHPGEPLADFEARAEAQALAGPPGVAVLVDVTG